MKDKLPDDQGMYWAKLKYEEWLLAYVDTGNERVTMFSENLDGVIYEFDEFPKGLVRAWYGPFTCPGGDFGSETVVASEEDHQRAKRNKEAIVIVHVDFRHCFDKRSGGSITSVATMPREQANEYVKRETEAFVADSK